MIDVALSRLVDDGDPECEVSWHGEWGLKDDSVGTEDSCSDLDELIGAILEDSQRWRNRFDVHFEWRVSGDRPAGGTIEDEIARLGIELPQRLQ